MLEKFLVLLERFVVAHELIAANSNREVFEAALGETVKVAVAESESVKKAVKEVAPKKAAPKKATKPEPEEEDLNDEEEPVKKDTEKKAAKPEVDLSELRAEIKMMAGAVGEGDNDDCADDFDDLMDEYDARTISKISDEDVVAFHADLKKLVSKYYVIED
ncbi:hypothetical protein [Hafnia phage TS33]|nr:hypothetical protein [Hafnia phage TS33]